LGVFTQLLENILRRMYIWQTFLKKALKKMH